MTALHFDTLATGLVYPEGPFWLDGILHCVEVLGSRLTRISAAGDKTSIGVSGGPNGAAVGPDGRVYVANNGGLSAGDIARIRDKDDSNLDPPCGGIDVVDPIDGSVRRLYDRCGTTPILSPNDIVFDRDGGFYFTDYGSVKRASPQAGRVYHARVDGSAVAPFGSPLERPNGVGLSPDGRTVYVSETTTGSLWRINVDDPTDQTRIYRDPALTMDSLAVQADGRICVACPHNDLIARIAPDGSADYIPTPAGAPLNICFGGPGLRKAYVTFLYSGVLAVADWDYDGLPLAYGMGKAAPI